MDIITNNRTNVKYAICILLIIFIVYIVDIRVLDVIVFGVGIAIGTVVSNYSTNKNREKTGGWSSSNKTKSNKFLSNKKYSVYNVADFKYDSALKDIAYRIVLHTSSDITKDQLQSTLDSIDVFKGCNFHRCWVAEYLPYWHTLLPSHVESLPQTVKFLQIGVFEGLSLIYLAKNILSSSGRTLEITVIDDFSTEQYFETEKTFRQNTSDLQNLTIIKKDSHSALQELWNAGSTFDFIYCSGSRKPAVCYVDFALLSKVVTPGSKILLDTYYSWSSYEGEISPEITRDTFCKSFARQIEETSIGKQKLIGFKEVVDDWVPREKPADCVPR